MIVLKGPEEIEIMRAANVIVAEVLAELRANVRPGVTTADLDRIAEEMTRKRGAVPAFKGYSVAGRVYPASLCASINDEVVHGIPSEARTLREGDIIGLDYGVIYKDYYGDSAVTVPVGSVSAQAEELMRTTREALVEFSVNVTNGYFVHEWRDGLRHLTDDRGGAIGLPPC